MAATATRSPRIVDAWERHWEVKERRLETGGMPLETIAVGLGRILSELKDKGFSGHLNIKVNFSSGVPDVVITEEKKKAPDSNIFS